MALPVVVTSHIWLPRDAPDNIVNRARIELSFRNPALGYYRHRRWKIPEGLEEWIKAYKIHNGRYALPRGHLQSFAKQWDLSIEDRRIFRKPKPIKNKIQLYPHQEAPVAEMMTVNEGILQAPCGSGKSIMALYLACQWGQNTLVLAHTNQIMEQWQEYIETLTHEKAGVIKGGTWDIQKITVASVMTLANRELSKEFLDYFGVVILDEAHHTPAYSFSSLLTMFPALRRIGISATPRRTDGLQGLLYAVAGPVRASVDPEELIARGFQIRPRVEIVRTKFFVSEWTAQREETLFARVEDDRRRARAVAKAVYKYRKRSVLVLSRRISHLELIHHYLKKMDPDILATVLTGQVKREDREEIINDLRFGDLNIVLATQLADEGLDVPRLDTIALSFPGSSEMKLEQQIGRIMRKFKGKEDAIILDVVDERVPKLYKQALRRMQFYRHRRYPIVA